jgi:hypothetical protein
MNLRNISTREQILIFIVALTVVAGGYGFLRYRPALKALAELQASNITTADRAKNAVIPEVPIEDPDELKEAFADAETELAATQLSMTDVEQRLAPIDSQELRLSISDVANNAGVRIRENVPYLVQRTAKAAAGDVAPARKLSKRQQRAAARAGGVAPAGAAVVAAAPKDGELIYRLVNDLDEPRPFQRMSIEGNFSQIQRFVNELGKLTSMVTVAQIQIDLSAQTPPSGYPQPLVVTMILAL